MVLQIAPTAAEDWPQRFSALRQQQQEQQQGGVPLPEPLEPQEAAAGEAGAGALPAAAGSAGVVRRVPLHPVDESEALKERVTLWLAGGWGFRAHVSGVENPSSDRHCWGTAAVTRQGSISKYTTP